MGRITLSEDAWGALAGVAGPVEVCDPKGRVVGRYIPETEAEQLVREARRLLSLEQVQRSLADRKSISNEEAVRRFNEAVEKHR